MFVSGTRNRRRKLNRCRKSTPKVGADFRRRLSASISVLSVISLRRHDTATDSREPYTIVHTVHACSNMRIRNRELLSGVRKNVFSAVLKLSKDGELRTEHRARQPVPCRRNCVRRTLSSSAELQGRREQTTEIDVMTHHTKFRVNRTINLGDIAKRRFSAVHHFEFTIF